MVSANPPSPFPIARYRLEFEVVEPIRLPDYAGSALRGGFGHALRHAACVTRERNCATCPLYRSCPYPAIFETPPPVNGRRIYSQIPNPFVVQPPPWAARDYPAGATLGFGLVLIGPALRHLPLILLSWQRAFQRGVGSGDGRASLLRVFVDGEPDPILEGSDGEIREHRQSVALPRPEAAPGEVTLRVQTPLRLKRAGHALGVGRLGAQDLLAALVRRTADICDLQLGEPTGWDFAALKASAALVSEDKDLVWRDWTRYSSRQQQEMTFGGAVGSITLRGDLRPFWPLLHLGQWLHVGSKATFGLGRYELNLVSPKLESAS